MNIVISNTVKPAVSSSFDKKSISMPLYKCSNVSCIEPVLRGHLLYQATGPLQVQLKWHLCNHLSTHSGLSRQLPDNKAWLYLYNSIFKFQEFSYKSLYSLVGIVPIKNSLTWNHGKCMYRVLHSFIMFIIPSLYVMYCHV